MVIELDSNFRIGNRVRELRLACGLSQEQLALEANITPAYLCQVERGNRNPTVALMGRLCTVLGVTLAEFFSEQEEKREEKREETRDLWMERIAAQLCGKSEQEKEQILQIIKCVFKIQNLG